eukprot:3928634-Rhodomonas_salina.1
MWYDPRDPPCPQLVCFDSEISTKRHLHPTHPSQRSGVGHVLLRICGGRAGLAHLPAVERPFGQQLPVPHHGADGQSKAIFTAAVV